MKLKTMLFRKGFFTSLNDERTGVNAHNENEIRFWRRVLDEQIIAALGTNSSAKEEAYKWFNSKPGDEGYFIADRDENGYKKGREYKVDVYEEYCEVCDLANLDPEEVTEYFERIVEYVQEEEVLSEGES